MKMKWGRHRHKGKPTEAAWEKNPDAKGAQTHIKREPCRVLSAAEKAAWLRALGLE